ncbi:TonB family protein [bacterium]
MNLIINPQKSRINIGIIASLTVHSLMLVLLFSFGIKKVKVDELITIDEVEFREKRVIKKKFNLLKMAMPKVVRKTVPKMQEMKPLLKEKAQPLKRKKKLDIDKKMDRKDKKLLDINKRKEKLFKLKDIDSKKIAFKSARPDLHADDVKALISLEAVGNKRVSKKTLETLNKIEKRVRVLKDFSPDVKLTEKKIKRIDTKLQSMDSLPVVSLQEKSVGRLKGMDIPDDNRQRRNAREMVIIDEAPIIEDKGKISRASRRIDTSSIGGEGTSGGEMKMMEAPVKRAGRIRDISKLSKEEPKKKERTIVSKAKRKERKNVEITGPLKDRKVLSWSVPEYPEWAKEEAVEASVQIFFVVNAGGEVDTSSIRVEITSGYRELDNLSIETLKKWRFSKIEGESQWGYIVFRFTLE